MKLRLNVFYQYLNLLNKEKPGFPLLKVHPFVSQIVSPDLSLLSGMSVQQHHLKSAFYAKDIISPNAYMMNGKLSK